MREKGVFQIPKLRGHEIQLLNGEWVYADNKQPTVETWQSRACGHCGLHNTVEGHDGCLGTLPNIMNACCGHGDVRQAYVQFWDDEVLNGQEAIEKIEELKGELE